MKPNIFCQKIQSLHRGELPCREPNFVKDRPHASPYHTQGQGPNQPRQVCTRRNNKGPNRNFRSGPLAQDACYRLCKISRASLAVSDGVLPTFTPAASRASFLA